MSVHYKFKSTLDYDTITFDGLHISVADLKKAILQQKRLSKITDFDLQIINAQTKEEYPHDSSLIPKNTSLIISRVPLTNQAKKLWEASNKPIQQPRLVPKLVESADFDLSKMEGSEEDKIQAMMMQSTADYDPKSYQKIRGYSQTGEVPPTYRCNKCKKGGHWIKNCPFNVSKEHIEVKRTTGIPKSFRDKDDRAMMIESQEPLVEEEKKQEIPEDLVCGICNDLFVDAVMIPCCGSSFCDDCVRTALLESEDNECPDCKEKGSSPGSLIPNRFLRNSVNAFKNRTGYKAATQAKKELFQEKVETDNDNKDENAKKPETFEEVTKTPSEDINEIDKKERPSNDSETKVSPSKKEKQEETKVPDIKKEKEKDSEAATMTSPAHEDSDFEDNIVVKVPPASDTRTEKYLGRRHGSSHPRPPGLEPNSPKSKNQSYQQDSNSQRSSNDYPGSNNKDWDRSPRETSSREHERDRDRERERDRERDRDRDRERERDRERDRDKDHYMYDKSRSHSAKPMDNVQPPGAGSAPVPIYPPHQSYDMQQQRPPIRPMNMHPGYHNHMHRPPLYPPHPNMPPHHPQVGPPPMRMPIAAMNSYEQPYNPIGNVVPGYQRFPSSNMPNRFNYPMREVENQNQMRPFNSIASVYETVAAKVGVGIIDDPLEAFNRIMKEKEKKKDDRRSPDRRRRSKERHIRSNFRPSPYNNRNSKDHGGNGGYHEKRGRSRERDVDRGRWPRYEKSGDKERDRDRERERERDKEHAYRGRRSKSVGRTSRSRSHSPHNKRYRSPSSTKIHSSQEKHSHHYHQKPRTEEHEELLHSNRHKREDSRGRVNIGKPLDSRGVNKLIDNEDRMADMRKPYSLNDENSEPPPPGFEIQTSRNPFHSNIPLSPPPSSNLREIRCQRNVTPDLYEKCVSQDLEENKMYNNANRSELRSRTRSRTRSPRRSRSRSSIRMAEKRRKTQRSTTPKGKPTEHHHKKEKDKGPAYSSHSKHKNEDRYSQKERDDLELDEVKRRSMTPPREKETHEHRALSDPHQTSSEEKSDRKSEKKLKDRKKKRKDKSERKKLKKEKKSKKERHRQKSEDKYLNENQEEGQEIGADGQDHLEPELDVLKNNIEESKLNKEFQLYDDLEEEGEYHSVEKELAPPNSTPKKEERSRTESTPKQHSIDCGEKTPPSDIKCFDAVLDIHEYETDFDDNSFKLQDNNNKLVPEASKWELEDQLNTPNAAGDDKLEESVAHNNNADSKVTNDVIVRAEKAIFARAINAIRPLELRKKSSSKERSSKSYPDDHDNIRNIKITLPVNISNERSVEVKNDGSEKKKSIKDRLGSKVSQPPMYSHIGDSRRDDGHGHKSSSYTTDHKDNERHNRGGGGGGIDSKVLSKKSENDRSSRDERERGEKDRERGERERVERGERERAERERGERERGERERSERERGERERGERERGERERGERERAERERFERERTERDRGERNRERQERDREREREERERERIERDRERGERERREKERERERVREREREREGDRDKEREREKEKDREREREKERTKEKERMRQREKHDGSGRERDNKDRERNHDRNHEHDNRDRSNKDYKLKEKSEKDNRESDNSRKRRQSHHSPVVQQRRRSPPSSSDSDSDEGGAERKRKQAKIDKKSRKRSESPDSDSRKSSKKKTKTDKKKKKKNKK